MCLLFRAIAPISGARRVSLPWKDARQPENAGSIAVAAFLREFVQSQRRLLELCSAKGKRAFG